MCAKQFPGVLRIHEKHFYANKAKTEVRQFVRMIPKGNPVGPVRQCKEWRERERESNKPTNHQLNSLPTPFGETKDDRAAKWHVVAQMCVEDAPVAFVHTTSADTVLVTGGVQTSCPRRAPLGITLPRGGLRRPGARLGVSTGTTH